jgi:V/A-type H+-transporting ATPase subunit I
LINIGAGLWETYNKVTGILGDVLSYIRLYALGLAGGKLGEAFNSLGDMVLGDTPNVGTWIGFLAIVIVGHLLNVAMSALGAFVHPLRLSFVEYFNNAGYEGHGTLYKPFKK